VEMANGIARLLETDLTFNPEELTIYYDYISEGYGIPTIVGMPAFIEELQND